MQRDRDKKSLSMLYKNIQRVEKQLQIPLISGCSEKYQPAACRNCQRRVIRDWKDWDTSQYRLTVNGLLDFNYNLVCA